MIFIRNANGSHNPDEAMAIEDFALAAGLLAGAIAPGRHLSPSDPRKSLSAPIGQERGCSRKRAGQRLSQAR